MELKCKGHLSNVLDLLDYSIIGPLKVYYIFDNGIRGISDGQGLDYRVFSV